MTTESQTQSLDTGSLARTQQQWTPMDLPPSRHLAGIAHEWFTSMTGAPGSFGKDNDTGVCRECVSEL